MIRTRPHAELPSLIIGHLCPIPDAPQNQQNSTLNNDIKQRNTTPLQTPQNTNTNTTHLPSPPPPLRSQLTNPPQTPQLALPRTPPRTRSRTHTHTRIPTPPHPRPRPRRRPHTRTPHPPTRPPHTLQLPHNPLMHPPTPGPRLRTPAHPYTRQDQQGGTTQRGPRRMHGPVGRDAHLLQELEIGLVAVGGVSWLPMHGRKGGLTRHRRAQPASARSASRTPRPRAIPPRADSARAATRSASPVRAVPWRVSSLFPRAARVVSPRYP